MCCRSMSGGRKGQANFVLTREAIRMLNEAADELNMPKSTIVELLIRKYLPRLRQELAAPVED